MKFYTKLQENTLLSISLLSILLIILFTITPFSKIFAKNLLPEDTKNNQKILVDVITLYNASGKFNPNSTPKPSYNNKIIKISENVKYNISTINKQDKFYQKNYKKFISQAEKISKKNKILFDSNSKLIICDIPSQKIYVINRNGIINDFFISTSKKGVGSIKGSKKTPAGWHIIHEKAGDDTPEYGVLKGRKFTGKIIDKKIMADRKNKRDHIVTRILWLKGLEPGINSGTNRKGQIVDSKNRTIYIHGTTMEYKLGTACTIGCIHVGLEDLLKLYNTTPENTLVYIRK